MSRIEYLDVAIKQDQPLMNGLHDKKKMPCQDRQDERAFRIGSELNVQCKYSVIDGHMHRLNRRLRRGTHYFNVIFNEEHHYF